MCAYVYKNAPHSVTCLTIRHSPTNVFFFALYLMKNLQRINLLNKLQDIGILNVFLFHAFKVNLRSMIYKV